MNVWRRPNVGSGEFGRMSSSPSGGLIAARQEAGIPLVGGVPSQRCRPLSWTVASGAGVLLALQDVKTSVY